MNGLGLNVQGINLSDEASQEPRWLEITEFLKEATEEFQCGQMVHVSKFSLSEAMSALELMDPKMDAGMDPPELGGEPVRLVPEYFERKLLKENNFTNEETIGIMDELFAGMIRWVAGDTLGQTVFTCLYLHQPGYLKDSVIRGYGLSILKICSLIRDVIYKGQVHEEEDFMFEPYSLPEMDVLSEDEALMTLSEISSFVSKEIEAAKSRSDAAEVSHKEAILARVSVAKLFMTLICQMTANALQPLEAIKKTTSALRPHLEVVKKTQAIGIQADSVGRMLGFQPFINRKLSVHSPPRPSEFLSRERTVDECSAILNQLESIASLPSTSDLLGIFTYLNYFARRKPAALIFTRSLLNSYLVRDANLYGKVPINQAVRNSLTQFSSSPYLTLKNPKIAKPIANFIQLASTTVAETIKTYCKNRARTRRRLKKLLIEWEKLQAEADAIDGEIDAIIEKVDPALKKGSTFIHFLTSWVYHHKTHIMLDWIWIGFETETFVPHEVLMTLWYGDCLLGAHLQNMQVITKAKAEITQASLDIRVAPEFSFQFSRQILARSILQVLCGCKTQGMYTIPTFEFLDPKVHFTHRFKALQVCATPAALPYEHFFSNVTFTADQISELFALAEDSFKVAKAAIERAMKMSPELNGVTHCQADFTEDTKAMARVCISNSIALKSILAYIDKATADPSHPKHTISLDFKYHPYFPVITLIPVPTK